jgi:glyoxylase-like metal-dependent hydrolase (beta-lactamase superfamily II)
MNVVDIRPDLRMVLDSGPGQAYLLRRGTQAVLIDTGIAGQGGAIADALADWGLDREALTHVLLTHWHPDHVGSAAEVGSWPNAQIWAHRLIRRSHHQRRTQWDPPHPHAHRAAVLRADRRLGPERSPRPRRRRTRR